MEIINNYILLATKFIFLLGTLIYFIFALIVVKQTTTLSRSVYDKFNSILIIFSYTHLVFSFFLILLTFIIL
ncbi:hypothetical protein A2574_02625 [Candidatus Shapirobacteria bacterium RIFOXYD1_FULL_38_32]|uniref:Uncharacterized protein n=1 Tax=Candidatus Shapirobacteria bacterium RIFOXYB1_FULL_38_38 TaxID=1802151 RepID=A0A1F7SQQ9_9BACT|nr:MAG: hypothetical protein A2195_02385 [Candidatus Shapirobacteria bacterium RIFOXYA1_FULL_39_17]OGL56073.1 MAG: hypothetical protein A2367_03695 [Candidatus Shapirobacteria bacterium RIFOXYB1_FULL_38_38]OGL57656.1 MAG: hypothetical protein A2574_02625 [Candidatus Shapirobacteria bacterium RIFOXYD1_FULL_38_32]OGL57836.1 MAG: hypothetical protein A2410_02310 [Candidatus Shapirobacteria bacterium RIFOXYC1_FULL_38_24]HAP38113.1 hypothetical protein [Candidatus Shapirobacteria bacterium]